MTQIYIEESRRLWRGENRTPTNEQLTLGCLQRIATATEKMCLDREKLERDYKYMRASRDRYRDRVGHAERRIAALKGVITKMKKKEGGYQPSGDRPYSPPARK